MKGTAYTLTGLTGLIIAVYFLAFNNPSDSVARLNPSTEEVQAAGDLENGNAKKENPSAGLLSSPIREDSIEPQLDQNKNKLSTTPVQESIPSTPKESSDQKNSLDKNSNPDIDGPKIISIDKAQPPSSFNDNGIAGQRPLSPGQAYSSEKTKGGTQAKSIEESSSLEPAKDDSSTGKDLPENNQVISDDQSSDQNDISVENDAATLSDPKPVVILPDSASQELSSNPIKIQSDPQRSTEIKRNNAGAFQPNALTQESVSINDGGSGNGDSAKNISPSSDTRQRIKPPYRWSLGLVFAPEFSTTRLSHYSAPGESIGLLIGYQLTNRFNINAGIIRSTKKYKDDGSEYSPNPEYWKNRTNGIVPKEIDSRCLVVEVPLDIQFDAIQTAKSRVFVSTAISSYFMVNQSYKYNFEAPNPGAANSWESPGSESYWFSVGMMSAGYERYIHRSLAIGIEPYLKISLAEIGWPNVKLFSTGAYLTLRYKFINRENRMSIKND